jgi:hypothetical protein
MCVDTLIHFGTFFIKEHSDMDKPHTWACDYFYYNLLGFFFLTMKRTNGTLKWMKIIKKKKKKKSKWEYFKTPKWEKERKARRKGES